MQIEYYSNRLFSLTYGSTRDSQFLVLFLPALSFSQNFLTLFDWSEIGDGHNSPHTDRCGDSNNAHPF